MVTRLRMYDISKPPGGLMLADPVQMIKNIATASVSKPPHCDAIAGYIGGDTPHVWTASEWAGFGKMRKLPIFVRSTPGVGIDDGFAALRQLYLLRVPKGNPVAYDKETNVSPAEVAAFNRVIIWGGYIPWTYGSISTVFQNKPINTWAAHFVNKPIMDPNPTVRATQYRDNFVWAGVTWDVSTLKWWQYRFRFTPW